MTRDSTHASIHPCKHPHQLGLYLLSICRVHQATQNRFSLRNTQPTDAHLAIFNLIKGFASPLGGTHANGEMHLSM